MTGINLDKVERSYQAIKKTINESGETLNREELMLLLSRVAHEAVNTLNVAHGSQYGCNWGELVRTKVKK